MKSVWDGAISFGLVNIPVSVFPATKSHELSFHFLHGKDKGRIHNDRVCEVCEEKVAYTEIVRGYEYEKDRFVILTDEDFEKVDLESAKSLTILDFVDSEEIDPMFFDKPYYLLPEKGGEKAYVLLREGLKHSGKVGIAKIILRTRESLAALKPKGPALMLDLMHFASEIKGMSEFKFPPEETRLERKELQMAEKLIDSMASAFKPERYHDTYHDNLMALIEKKLKGKEIKAVPKRHEATNVIDLMSKLKASLEENSKRRKRKTA